MGEKWWTKRWVQNAGLVLIVAVAVYGLIYRDVVSRAKESYLEAEKYMDWNLHPERKKEFLENKFQSEKNQLDKKLADKKITEEAYKEKLQSLDFDREFAMQESSLKYAYQWYKDTYELFSPPESQWVRWAREKAPQALELWKKELDEKKIPFENYMFE